MAGTRNERTGAEHARLTTDQPISARIEYTSPVGRLLATPLGGGRWRLVIELETTWDHVAYLRGHVGRLLFDRYDPE